MGGNERPPNMGRAGVPLLGQQQMAQQAAAQQIALSIYVPLVPQLALYRLREGYPSDGGFDKEDATPERIAKEAKEITDAAMMTISMAPEKQGDEP